MRIGEAATTQPKAEKRASVAPKKSGGGGGDDAAKATSIGELIKQKLGAVQVKGKEPKAEAKPAAAKDDEEEGGEDTEES
jgi:hypothetical protein